MKLQEAAKSAKKIATGIKIKFETIKLPNKSKVMAVVDEQGKRYVIKKSLENFSRFHKWKNKEVMSDIKKLREKIKTERFGILPLIKIRTTVKIEGEEKEKEDVVT